ncbi:MAG TPA: hypothetical protein DCE10_02425, partial [Acidimicrobiaceae bacterium]|nr:hypothetical protein [Acidimicrobiaceae bacterium]
ARISETITPAPFFIRQSKLQKPLLESSLNHVDQPLRASKKDLAAAKLTPAKTFNFESLI